jgi:hypothetical protein
MLVSELDERFDGPGLDRRAASPGRFVVDGRRVRRAPGAGLPDAADHRPVRLPDRARPGQPEPELIVRGMRGGPVAT